VARKDPLRKSGLNRIGSKSMGPGRISLICRTLINMSTHWTTAKELRGARGNLAKEERVSAMIEKMEFAKGPRLKETEK